MEGTDGFEDMAQEIRRKVRIKEACQTQTVFAGIEKGSLEGI